MSRSAGIQSNHIHVTISENLRLRVAKRLGLEPRLETNIQGLYALYGAWCRKVPFDNVRKLIALRTGDAGPLPGGDATDFLENFLEHGTGGTCWSSSNALFELATAFGFRARRISGSMRDLGATAMPLTPPPYSWYSYLAEHRHASSSSN